MLDSIFGRRRCKGNSAFLRPLKRLHYYHEKHFFHLKHVTLATALSRHIWRFSHEQPQRENKLLQFEN